MSKRLIFVPFGTAKHVRQQHLNSAEFGAKRLDQQPLDLAAEQDLNHLLWSATQNVVCTIGDEEPVSCGRVSRFYASLPRF